jgi:hypothetical protein
MVGEDHWAARFFKAQGYADAMACQQKAWRFKV